MAGWNKRFFWITCKSVWLRINYSEPKKEELSVNNTSQLCSELLDFSVERFSGSICRAMDSNKKI